MIYRFAKGLFFLYFKIFNRVKFIGKENILKDGALIVYANHYSDTDIFILTVAFDRQIKFMAKKSLFEIPVVKHFVKAYGAFPVDRDGNDISAVRNALKILKNGEVLGIFPEGTRVRNEAESDPKGGFAMIAYKTKTPMQPVRIKYKRKLMLFNKIDVIIGEPITWDNFKIEDTSSDGYGKASSELMKKVYSFG